MSTNYEFVFVKITPNSHQEVTNRIDQLKKDGYQFPTVEAGQEVWLQASSCGNTKPECAFVEGLYKNDQPDRPDSNLIRKVTQRLKILMHSDIVFYEQEELFSDGKNNFTFILHKHYYCANKINTRLTDSRDIQWFSKKEDLLQNGYILLNINFGYINSDYEVDENNIAHGCVIFAMVMCK